LYQKIWLDDLERMGRSRFSINPGDDRMLEDPGKDGMIKKKMMIEDYYRRQ
jgi:hypothetical protein